ncbi:MAG TPA: tetratricopeptide repeat protein, partial [Planctomycetota bacterium]|nr:tetratricopeptide repeat protein [Planctomycetota bacterium]
MRPTPHRPAAPRFAVVVLCCAAAAAPLAAQDAAPVSADERLQLGLGLQRRGLHEEASRELEAFLAAAPRHASAAEAWYRLGLARLELKKPAEAVAAFEKALQQGGGAFARRVDAGYRLGLA